MVIGIMLILMTDKMKAVKEVVFLHGDIMLLGFIFPTSNPVE